MARSESRTVMEWKRGFAPPGTVPSPSGLAASAPPLRPCSQQQAEIQASPATMLISAAALAQHPAALGAVTLHNVLSRVERAG